MGKIRSTRKERILVALLAYELGAICPAELWRGVCSGFEGRNPTRLSARLPGMVHERLRRIRRERALSFESVMKECSPRLAAFLTKVTA